MQQVKNIFIPQYNLSHNQQQIKLCYNYLLQIQNNNTSDISIAQQKLQIMSQSPYFINNIICIPLISGISSDISKLAYTYIKTYIKKILTNNNFSLALTISQQIIHFITETKLSYQLKQLLALSISLVITFDQNQLILTQCMKQLTNTIQHSCSIAQPSKINYDLICILMRLILDHLPDPPLPQLPFLLHILPNLIQLILMTIQLLPQEIQSNKNTLPQALSVMHNLLQSLSQFIKKLSQIPQPQNPNILPLIDNQKMTQLLIQCFTLNLTNNKQKLPIFYLPIQPNSPYTTKTIQNFHKIKLSSINILTNSTIIFNNINNYNCLTSISQSLLIKQSSSYIMLFIKSISSLLINNNCHQFYHLIQSDIIQQIYSYLGHALQSNKYYQLFFNVKGQIIHNCLFKTLIFSKQDYYNSVSQPQQFVNSIYHIFSACQPKKKIIAITPKLYSHDKDRKHHNNDIIKQSKQLSQQPTNTSPTPPHPPPFLPPEQSLQLHDNIKTTSAKLLIKIIQYIDGSLLQLSLLCFMILNNSNQDVLEQRNLMWLILCIVKDQITDTKLKNNIGYLLGIALTQTQLPYKSQKSTPNNQNFPNIQFPLILITVDRYLKIVHEYNDNFLQTLFLIVQQLMINPQVDNLSKILSAQLIITMFANLNQQQDNGTKILWLMSTTLSPTALNTKSLDCILMIIQQQPQKLKQDLNPLLTIIDKILDLLIQSNTNTITTSHIVTQLWNILQQIFSNSKLISEMQHYFHLTIYQLLEELKKNYNQIFQEHLYTIIINMIRIKNNITKFQLQIVDLAKNHFYSDTFKYTLKSKFAILQCIVYYGQTQLSTNILSIKTLLQMSIYSIQQPASQNKTPRSQSQQCEGVLLMQSLMLSLCKSFDKQMWLASLKCLYKKLKQPDLKYDFLKINIINNITIILVFAHKYLNPQQLTQLINLILLQHNYFTFINSTKIFTILITILLSYIQIPFILSKYLELLDCTITMLKMIKMGKDKLLINRNYDKQQLTYLQLQAQTLIYLKNIDQFLFFYQTVVNINNKNHSFLDNIINSLPGQKKLYFYQVINSRKIHNQVRTIYKFKKKS